MSARSRGELNGFLDKGSHLRGELHFRDTFRVDGRITGKIISKGELVVGEEGTIDGEIEVGTLFVSGAVQGKVKAARRIEITAGGRVQADLETPSLQIEDGAHFEGGCLMRRDGGDTPTPPGRVPIPGGPERPITEG